MKEEEEMEVKVDGEYVNVNNTEVLDFPRRIILVDDFVVSLLT